MSDENTASRVPKFDGHYAHWSELMENFLRAKGLWGIVERGIGEPLDGTLLSDNQRILDMSNAKAVWESLKRKYGGNDKVKKATRNSLSREFELLEMNKTETVDDYCGRVTTISNKMRSNGSDIKDTMIVEKILRTLTEKFTYIVVTIEESHNIEEMSVDELQSTLALHEKKFKMGGVKEEPDQVLQVESRFV
ncbi:hypothetical protein LIER_41252 [Lithospermum erythrorhizon]|uniref:Retrovirus-related Pol polyprotein from transposon TNT 1-94 n=1 Tax=Lithospermum erythrorhizon TaxID=34254 RepID=A0AAV3RAE4_LITER